MMIKEEQIKQIINELNDYKGLVETGDEAFNIVEQKLKQLIRR